MARTSAGSLSTALAQLGEVKQDQQPDPRTNLKRFKPEHIDITLLPPQRDAQMWGLKSGFIRLLVSSSPSYISTFPKPRPGLMPTQFLGAAQKNLLIQPLSMGYVILRPGRIVPAEWMGRLNMPHTCEVLINEVKYSD